ncbi:MAG: CehA/McbA family metallohydrolase [Planctomycetes bacterium]|nr:CehA/McbA family metallohydrolase [Planctomycetota bacterium]
MSVERPKPHVFEDTHIWMRQVSQGWQFKPPADLCCSVEPGIVQAASGHTFIVTMKLGPDLTIPTGGHITMGVPHTWEAHLGNCFRRAIKTVGNREQVNLGYGAYTDVECSNADVSLVLEASYGRIYDLVDVVVAEGELKPGDEVRLILGPNDNCLLQAQKYAQVAIFSTGVDLDGNMEYLQAAEHPTVKVVGAYADRLRVFAPAVVRSREEFDVRVLPVDIYSFNPATNYRGRVEFFSDGEMVPPPSVEIDTSASPKGVSAKATAPSSGVHYLTALDAKTGISGRSNPIAVDFLPDRHIYFGEMHSQMWESMGTGTTEEFFEWGRDNGGLDFCCPANHYNQRYEVTDEIWQELVDCCNRYNEPGRFVTMVSYEWASGAGHKNVYYRDEWGEFDYWYRDKKNPDQLWETLEGRDVLTIPHHPKGCGILDWSYRNDMHQRLMEICSSWCLGEVGGGQSAQKALALGHRVGFVGGTDSHYGLACQGSYHVNDGNGMACVMATELTRDAIWQALWDRRCYATTGDKIVLDFTMNGHPLGSDIAADLASAEPRAFHMRVAGTYCVDKVEIIRNNEVVFTAEPGQDVWEGEWTDDSPLDPIAPTFDYDRPFVFYYMRVTQGNYQQAWASPIWLTQEKA